MSDENGRSEALGIEYVTQMYEQFLRLRHDHSGPGRITLELLLRGRPYEGDDLHPWGWRARAHTENDADAADVEAEAPDAEGALRALADAVRARLVAESGRRVAGAAGLRVVDDGPPHVGSLAGPVRRPDMPPFEREAAEHLAWIQARLDRRLAMQGRGEFAEAGVVVVVMPKAPQFEALRKMHGSTGVDDSLRGFPLVYPVVVTYLAGIDPGLEATARRMRKDLVGAPVFVFGATSFGLLPRVLRLDGTWSPPWEPAAPEAAPAGGGA